VDICPTGAIQLAENSPVLDPDLCVLCGACVNTCPTDVFSQISPPEQTLALTIQHLPPTAPLELVCPLRPGGAQTQAPVAAIVHHARCLAALSASDLIELSSRGARPLWLDDSPCAACSLAACHPLLLRATAGANELLAASGRSPSLALSTTHADQLLDAPIERPLLDGMKPRLSRRGFFGALRQMGQERVERARKEEAPPMLRPAVAVDERLPRHLPHSHTELLACLAGLAAGAVDAAPPADRMLSLAALPFAALTVAPGACSACGLCARFCPTGALRFDGPGMGLLGEDDDTAYALSFQARLCIDCAICRAACPEDAIDFEDSLPLDTVLSGQTDCLAAG